MACFPLVFEVDGHVAIIRTFSLLVGGSFCSRHGLFSLLAFLLLMIHNKNQVTECKQRSVLLLTTN